MVSLVAGAGIAALGKWWGGWFAGWEVLALIIDTIVGFLLTTTVFALIYKLMPRVSVSWADVWVGATVTALLFTMGRFLISLYIGKTGIASGFGAAGSIAVIFVWVYYSAQVFLVGAEFTWVYAQRFGSRRHHALPTAESARIAPPIPERVPAAAPTGVAVVGSHHDAAQGADANLGVADQRSRSSMLASPVAAAAALGVAVLLMARLTRWRSRRDSLPAGVPVPARQREARRGIWQARIERPRPSGQVAR